MVWQGTQGTGELLKDSKSNAAEKFENIKTEIPCIRLSNVRIADDLGGGGQ